MKTNRLFKTVGVVSILLILMAALAFSQGNLKVKKTVAGSGWFNVSGNVDNSGATDSIRINPIVNLNGSGGGTQGIGNSGSPGINFVSLRSVNTKNKQVNVFSYVDSLFYNMSGGTWSLNGQRLMIRDTVRNDNTVIPSFTSGHVNYAKTGGSRQIYGANYDTLTISGSATYSLQGVLQADSLIHSGGALTINQNLTVNKAATFATVADVTATLALGTDQATIATLSNNHGTITGNTGAVTFTNGATNNGAITGGAGLVTFSNALAQQSGTIAAGSGDILFNGAVTASAGSITAAASTDSLRFASTLDLSGTASLSATSGRVRFDGAVTGSSLFALASGSSAYFEGLDIIPAATYGNLYADVAIKTAGGDINVAGNLNLNQNIVMNGDTLFLTTASSTVNDTGEVVGAVNRNHIFGAANYSFNRSDVYMAFVGGAGNVTLTMSPVTSPSSLTSPKYVNRKYAFSGSTLPGNLTEIQLHYAAGEVVGGANEGRLVIQEHNGGWNKFPTGYTRTSGSGLVKLTGLSSSLASINEFAMTQAELNAKASGSWADNNTWDEGYQPTSSDDVTIPNGFSLTSTGSQAAASIVFTGTSALDIQGGTLTASGPIRTVSTTTINLSGGGLTSTDTIWNYGTYTSATAQTTEALAFVNNTSIDATIGIANLSKGLLDTLGTMNFNGNLTTDTVINLDTINLNGNTNSMAANVYNNGGTIVLAASKTLSLATLGSGYYVNGNGNWTINGTATVGTGSFLNNMTTNNLIVNSLGNLHVYGDLQVDNNLTNDGVVTVGP